METIAVVLKQPEQIELSRLALTPPTAGRRRHRRRMERGVDRAPSGCCGRGGCRHSRAWAIPWCRATSSVGRVIEAGTASELQRGQRVFVPGAKCFGEVRGLFGAIGLAPGRAGEARGAARSASRRSRHPAGAGGDGLSRHRCARRRCAGLHCRPRRARPAAGAGIHRGSQRSACGVGEKPGAHRRRRGYGVLDPEHDTRRDYKSIYDVSGDAGLLDSLIGRIAPGGEIVLAGFYSEPLSFAFPPAFMREARIRVAAEWQPADLRRHQGADRIRTAVARRPDNPPPRRHGRSRGLSHCL